MQTLLDTLWGEKRYHLIVTVYNGRVTVRVLNRNNGHDCKIMLSVAEWNELHDVAKIEYFDWTARVVADKDKGC